MDMMEHIIMHQSLDMNSNSIIYASQLTALSYVQTPTLRATLIEFYDVATSGATDSLLYPDPQSCHSMIIMAIIFNNLYVVLMYLYLTFTNG